MLVLTSFLAAPFEPPLKSYPVQFTNCPSTPTSLCSLMWKLQPYISRQSYNTIFTPKVGSICFALVLKCSPLTNGIDFSCRLWESTNGCSVPYLNYSKCEHVWCQTTVHWWKGLTSFTRLCRFSIRTSASQFNFPICEYIAKTQEGWVYCFHLFQYLWYLWWVKREDLGTWMVVPIPSFTSPSASS